ncbi:MAG: 3-hydroxyacyl-ACP dehydratase FabZ, partial [Candidatus Omnitrophica bacterium]|nr:3-hydroxyacyl-ACP dehydratase FabZ [Candidatus Omnitrophota bacterium]
LIRRICMLDFERIKSLLPQKFPFFMVDTITEIHEGKKVIGIKNITGNEICFLGHFPDESIFPGTLIIESMAQVSTFLFFKGNRKKQKLDFYLGAVKEMRFMKPVVPGDQLCIEAEALRLSRDTAYVKARANVDMNVVAEGELVFVRRK